MKVVRLLCSLFFLCFVQSERVERYHLKQTVILSRHGLRSPLSNVLTQMTPKKWPVWKEKPGYLTAKGVMLEGIMGKFFALWLRREGVITKSCPGDDIFYVYSNTKQRTLASANAFVGHAFPGCNITIHHTNSSIDPIFNPVIHNSSSIYIKDAKMQMQNILKKLSLTSSYQYLDNLLDYKDSELCKTELKCDLINNKNKIDVKPGQKPNVLGPIKIGNSVTDAFKMQYYEGFPKNEVAWGLIESSMDWWTLINLSKGYHNVIFNTTVVARDISEPLIKYMSTFFLNCNAPRVTLLMGHDANLYTLLNSLKFKPYILPEQYELIPIGGKIVFQKWFDSFKRMHTLKIDYVYQSSEQLRSGKVLDMENPPKFKLLELADCPIDNNGFCSWDNFVNILKEF